ncbi:MAG: cobalamin-dependent protein [Pseudomonadota bacterium]
MSGRLPGGDRGTDALLVGGLRHTIEAAVIPHLLAKSDHDERVAAPVLAAKSVTVERAARFSRDDVIGFSDLLVEHDASVAHRLILSHLADGLSVVDVLIDLCARAAAELGDRWLRDECSFCDVTVGLSTLEQAVLRCTSNPSFATEGVFDAIGLLEPSALFASMSTNHHVFGLTLVREVFRASGWQVRTPSSQSTASLLSAVRNEFFSVLGLSVDRTSDLKVCRRLIKTLKKESRNPRLVVVVGGQGVSCLDATAHGLGADIISVDLRETLREVATLVGDRTAPEHIN